MPNLDQVKVFKSKDTGAPALIGATGSVVNFLDAVLLNGYNQKAVASISVAAGVATLTTNSEHGYTVGQVLTIAGASESLFNDEFVVVSVPTATTLTFTAPAGAPASATGASITAKVAPLGWQKQWSGTNIAAYRSADPRSNQPVLHVDNTFAYWARVRMYESMSSISQGVGGDMTQCTYNYPTAAGQAYGVWQSGIGSETTPKDWVLVGNSRLFYWFPKINQVTQSYVNSRWWYGFGEFRSAKVGDMFNALLMANFSATFEQYPNHGAAQTGAFYPMNPVVGGHIGILRAMHGLNSLPAPGAKGSVNAGVVQAYSGVSGSLWPSWGGNVVSAFPCLLWEMLGLRGNLPGLYFLPHAFGEVMPPESEVTTPDLPGRRLALIRCPAGSSNQGLIGVDFSGPWSM